MKLNCQRLIVDTGVPCTANGISGQGRECVQRCVEAITEITSKGHIVVDDKWAIIKEYMGNLSQSGQPGVGDAFLKWVLTNQFNQDRCTRVPITAKTDGTTGFEEFPNHPELIDFDPSDRKFVAVSASHGKIHGKCPSILNGGDCKWWGWKDALAECDIHVEFLCPESKEKYKEKIEQKTEDHDG